MPRKRDGVIRESLEVLERLESEYRGKPEAARIRAVRLLKEAPERQIEEVAAMIGYSAVSVKRWLKAYRQEGLENLIQMGFGGKADKGHDGGISLLKQKLLKGELQGLREVKQWIDGFQSVEKEYVEMRGRTTRNSRTNSGTTENREPALNQEPMADRSREILDCLLTALPALSASRAIIEWCGILRRALQNLFGDIDHITINMNLQCPIDNPGDYKSLMVVHQNADSDKLSVTPAPGDDATPLDHEAARLARFWQNLRETEFDIEKYHPPTVKFYYYGDTAYIGFMVFWRERGRQPISEETITAIERLRPFFIYAFSDFIARQYVVRPMDFIFRRALTDLKETITLTLQEERVLYLQLVGRSYEEIAQTLSISVNTVRTHVKSIYTKTGTHSQAEFVGKYFTPYLHSAKQDK